MGLTSCQTFDLKLRAAKPVACPLDLSVCFWNKDLSQWVFTCPSKQSFIRTGERVQFRGLVADLEAAKALMVFGDYLDGNTSLIDGQILYEAV